MGHSSASARPSPMGPAFRSALDAARNGDGRGFEALYRAYARSVAGYVANQGVADVEAAANECFVRAFRSLDGFEGEEDAFRAWLFRIAHNLVIDERRKASRRPVCLATFDEACHDAAAPGADADALDRVGTARVQLLLARLAPDQRDVLSLRLVADLTCEQVAETLGKSLGAVKQLQRRGLDSLRRILAREGVTL